MSKMLTPPLKTQISQALRQYIVGASERPKSLCELVPIFEPAGLSAEELMDYKERVCIMLESELDQETAGLYALIGYFREHPEKLRRVRIPLI